MWRRSAWSWAVRCGAVRCGAVRCDAAAAMAFGYREAKRSCHRRALATNAELSRSPLTLTTAHETQHRIACIWHHLIVTLRDFI